MMFALEPEDFNRVDDWLHSTVYPPLIETQLKRGDRPLDHDHNGRPIPYCGAIGGGLTYQFTPTSLGTVVKVSFGDHVLDLTDYESW